MTPKLVANQLRIMGWGFIIFGLIFVTISFSDHGGFAYKLAPIFDWTGGGHNEVLTRDTRWFNAIMSGLSAGFGAFYVFVIAPILTTKDAAARKIAKRGGLLAALIWFIVDSTGSLGAGVPSNVVTNSIFFILIFAPLLMVKFPD